MYTSLSGKLAISKQLDVIANNLANMTTTGFRAEKLLFEQYSNPNKAVNFSNILDQVEDADTLSSSDYVKVRGSVADFSQGALERTGNALDIAIEGEGFFVVQTPDGERYTRAGDFRLDTTNRLVTQQGWPVQGSGGDISITGKQIQIGEDGTISVDGQSGAKIRVVKINAQDALHEAGTIFKLKEGASPVDNDSAIIKSGFIEGSNVNAVRELTDMILAAKIFESFSSVDSANKSMTEARNSTLGRQS